MDKARGGRCSSLAMRKGGSAALSPGGGGDAALFAHGGGGPGGGGGYTLSVSSGNASQQRVRLSKGIIDN